RFTVGSAEMLSLHPTRQLLFALTISVAVPFFVVSTTAPLLQNWVSRTTHVASSDPYFLYSASNAGSLLALIAYPFFIEPIIGVKAQSGLWFGGYLGLVLMFAFGIVVVYRRHWAVLARPHSPPAAVKTRLYCIGAAFVPSGLMLAVTSHIAENVGSVPFLCIVP